MIKKIDIHQLKVGMFVHDLICHWMDHPFVRNRFRLSSEEEIRKIIAAGIHEVYINTDKGLDVDDAPTAEEVRSTLEQEIVEIAARQPATTARVSLAEELTRAKQVKNQAHQLVRTVMHDARMGKAIELDRVEPVVQNITESILRNPGALTGLLRIKNKDDYTFLHSVSVCTLLVAFCRSAGMDAETIRQAGIGGLLHDTGKALVPDDVLNKPGRLTDAEFEIIRKHPRDGHDILLKSNGIGDIPLDITLHHHERMDGNGYPNKHSSEKISTFAQMAAIVDVYDAITADRCYHKGVSAAEALRMIFEWSKFHFEREQVQRFIRCVGIYPVGTMVRLESGKLGIVTESHETNLLAPKVRIFFDTKAQSAVRQEDIDLSRPFGKGGGDRIVGLEPVEKWRAEQMMFLNPN